MKQTAQGLAALGRGPDTQLVHMAPSEVAGLQALAQHHGGSLTINPETGLPEAGFLSSILPTLIGAGLSVASGGTLTPLMAAMMTGGGYALAKGSLKEGLMAGLGAYGGAGLGASLASAGTGALSSAAGAAVPEIATGSIVPQAALPAATEAVSGMSSEMLARGAAEGIRPGADMLLSGAQVAPAPVIAAQGVQTLTPMYTPAQNMGAALAQDQAAAQAVGSKLATTTPMQTIGAGLKSVTSSPSAALEFAKQNVQPLSTVGIAALGGMQPDAMQTPDESKGLIRPYTYSREKIPSAFEDVAGEPRSSRERRYFTEQYTAGKPYAAPGPEYMAAGGPVEAMSNANTIGANTGYPQSAITPRAYATPFQQPMPQNVVSGAQDAGVDPYTGQAQFADGGSVGGYTYDPATGQYSGGRGSSRGTPSGVGVISRVLELAHNNAPLAQSGAGAIGGYAYDPITQAYTRPAAVGATAPTPMTFDLTAAEINRDSGGMATGGLTALAAGGATQYNLGGYSDGGRLLRGPGDGVSDDIPAVIGQKQPARLADGEFVVPARIVSELGNGSTEAGARKLYAMMDRVQKARKKSIGKDKVAADSKAHRMLPA